MRGDSCFKLVIVFVFFEVTMSFIQPSNQIHLENEFLVSALLALTKDTMINPAAFGQ